MNIKKVSPIVLILLFSMMATAQQKGQATMVIESGVLGAVKSNSVTFNGITYQYKIDRKLSVMAIDEVTIEPIEIRDLKVGQSYYYEKISYKNEASKAADFSQIIFISKTKPTEVE